MFTVLPPATPVSCDIVEILPGVVVLRVHIKPSTLTERCDSQRAAWRVSSRAKIICSVLHVNEMKFDRPTNAQTERVPGS